MRTPLALSLLLLCLLIAPARAQDPDPAFHRHVQRGKRLADSGDYAGAVREYRAAYHLRQVPGLLFNLGQAHRMLGNAADALGYYEMYLRKEPNPSPEILTELEEYIQQTSALSEAAVQKKEEVASMLRRLRQPDPPPQRPPTPLADSINSGPEPPPDGEGSRRPVHRKGWFWATLVGSAAIVAGGVAAGVVLGTRAQGVPDPRDTPLGVVVF